VQINDVANEKDRILYLYVIRPVQLKYQIAQDVATLQKLLAARLDSIKINTKGQEISWPNATYYLGCFRSFLLSKNAAENKYAPGILFFS